MLDPKQAPTIVVNFKCYPEATGSRAVEMARQAEEVREKTGVNVIVCPQLVDIATVSKAVKIPVFAQHIDPIRPGPYTGHTPPEAVREAGASGTIINHSERQLLLSAVEACVARAREAGLVSLVCANTAAIAAAVLTFRPDMIAIEPPELIGTGVSVSKARPEVITDTVKLIRSVDPDVAILCGAGITKDTDVEVAVKLGTQGILVSSGVVKAPDPGKALLAMAEGAIRGMKQAQYPKRDQALAYKSYEEP